MFLSKLLNWLLGLFSAMKRSYKKLTELEQQLSIVASGIVAIINKNLNVSPEIIVGFIRDKYPSVRLSDLDEYLRETLKAIEQPIRESLHDNIITVQSYLTTHTSNLWVNRTQSLVGALITVLLPSTPLPKITAVLEYIYHKLVKPKL